MVKRIPQEQAPEVSLDDVLRIVKKAGIELYKDRAGMPLNQAQRNLEGRTHYVDDATLRSFVAKIHSVSIMDEGLILGLVESVQAGPNSESGRLYRPVLFDVFGNTIALPDLEHSFKTLKQAQSEFWKAADEVDAVELTIEGLKRKRDTLAADAETLDKLLEELE